MYLNANITVLCESVRPGCSFSARFFDRDSSTFYSGQGATALEAIAWCLADYVERACLGRPHRMAMPSSARPHDLFDLGDIEAA